MTPESSPTPRMDVSLERVLLALRVIGGVIVLAAMSLWVWKATHWEDRLELVDTFDTNAPIRSFMQRAEGIYIPGEGLAVPGGTIAKRQYGITHGESHRLFVHIEQVPGTSGRIGAWLTQGGETTTLDTSTLDGRAIEVTDLMKPGNAMLELWIENTAPVGSPPVALLKSFRVTRHGAAPPPHLPTMLFYGATGALFWLTIFCFALPEGLAQLLTERTGLEGRNRPIWAGLLLAVVIGAAWLLSLPEWDQLKDYDDRAAVGNAAALIDTGFDQSNVYFRSRVRPGFLGIAQPILALSPHRLSGYWSNASDNFRQDWLIYDQEGWDYGLFTYPHLVWMSQGLALVMILGFYGIYRRLDVAPVVALLATILGTLYYGRSLTIAITQTINLCINVLVVWHFLSGGERANARYRFVTGLLLGLAFLVKETAATTVIALGLFTLIDGPPKAVVRRVLDSVPMWAGALVWPGLYFGGIAEGGFRELFTNFDNHLGQEQLNQFDPLTWSTGFRDMRVVFSLLGLGAVAAGLAAGSAKRFRSRADRFMVSWAIGCLPVFTLPYIFPRFLKYFAPSFAYWSVRVLGFRREKADENNTPGENA